MLKLKKLGELNMLFTKRISSLVLLSLLSSVVSCSSINSSGSEEITVTDSLNREIKVDLSKIKKVVCVGAGALRLFSYVGNLDLLSGAEDIDRNIDSANTFKNASRPYYDVNVEKFEKLPSCGVGGPEKQSPEYDKILNCAPDIVFSEYTDENVVKNMEENLQVPIVCLSYGSNSVFDENVKKSLNVISTICKNEKSKALIKYIEESEASLKSYKNENSTDKWYVGCLGNWGKQTYTSTSNNYPLFNVNNLTNAFDKSYALQKGQVNLDALITADPTVMILDSAGIDLFKDAYNKDSVLRDSLANISAVKNNKVYLQMPFNAYYTNLEIALMDAYYISSIAYPDKYTNVNLEDKYNEISEKFLGVRCYSQIKSKPASKNGFQNIGSLSTFFSN